MKVTAHEFEVVEMIAFCVKRKFFAELGYSSVMNWLMKAHGYPKSCAYRRIEAAKLVTSVPDAIERVIAVEFPEIVKDKVESVKPVSATETCMTVVFTDEQMALLERVREVTGHSHFGASWSELMAVMAKEFLKRHDPVQMYRDPMTANRCEARTQLEVDHIIPRAFGGANDPENLRTCCRTHNQLSAFKLMGSVFMNEKIGSRTRNGLWRVSAAWGS